MLDFLNTNKLNKVTENKLYKIVIPFSFVISLIDMISLSVVFIFISIFSGKIQFEISNLIFTACLVFFAFLVVIRVFALKFLNENIHSCRHVLSRKIFKIFLFNGRLGKNTAMSSVNTNMFSEVEQVINNYIVPLSGLVQAVSISIFTISVLMYQNFLATLFIGCVFLSIYGGAYLITNKFSAFISKERLEANDSRFNIVDKAIQSIKSVIVYKAQDEIINKFDAHSVKLSKYIGLNQTLGILPRYILEAIIFIAFISFIVFADMEKIGLDFLFLVAVSSIKLLPSFQSIFSCLNSFRFGLPSLKALLLTLQQKKIDKNFLKHSDSDHIVEVDIKKFTFGDKSILKDVRFSISNAGLISIVGESGVGKTTLINLILRLEQQNEAKITYAEKYKTFNAFLDKVGYIAQDLDVIEGSVLSNLYFYRDHTLIDESSILSIMKEVGLGELFPTAKSLEQTLDFRGAGLSGGQRQRLALARAMLYDPDILLIDEPTSALDAKTEKAFIETLKRVAKTKTVLAVTHSKLLIENSDFIIDLNLTR